MASALMTKSEVREHIESDMSDAVLVRLIDAADAAIRHQVGNHLNLTYTGVIVDAKLTAHGNGQDLWNSGIYAGDLTVVEGLSIGRIIWSKVARQLTIGRSLASFSISMASVFEEEDGGAANKSLYFVNRLDFGEVPHADNSEQGAAQTSVWTLPNRDDYVHTVKVLDSIEAGDKFEFIIADAGTVRPLDEDINLAERRHALIDLVQIAARYTGLQSGTVGTYSYTNTDYHAQRTAILTRLQLAVKGREGILA